MHLIQLFVTALFIASYTNSFLKHGEPLVGTKGEDLTFGTMLVGMLIIHGIYYWGGFYKVFDDPQRFLLLWDAVGAAILSNMEKPLHYNRYRTLADATVTFTCLFLGGFYS